MPIAALSLLPALLGCSRGDLASPDRLVPVDQPFSEARAEDGAVHVSGTIEFVGGRIEDRRVAPSPLSPERLGRSGTPVEVAFTTVGLAGAKGRLGLLPPRGAARQEVAFDTPGQPDDRRSRWVEIEIEADGSQRFELPAPGPNWHPGWAVIALELRRGRTPLHALAGARSEMLSGKVRSPGARVFLGTVEVERRPTRVAAPMVEPGAIELDGVLDEPSWQRGGEALLHSRTGEPATDLAVRLGGPSEVWFAWDREQLYVAASLPDRDLYAPHRERDQPLYRDEAFEVFVAGDNSATRYLEHEVSPRNVVFDAHFPSYRKGDEGYDGTWRSAVALDGELRKRGGDLGWTVELAFPWTELCEHTAISCPPAPGQEIRVNVFRLDKPDRKHQVALALSPTLEPDFHAWQNAAELVLEGSGP